MVLSQAEKKKKKAGRLNLLGTDSFFLAEIGNVMR